MSLTRRRLTTLIAAAALGASPLAAVAVASAHSGSAETAGTASAAAATSAVAARISLCDGFQYKPVGNGWTNPVPSVWESSSTYCNLKYGDLPFRDGIVFGDPATSIKALQRNLNYCYGTGLAVDGLYGSKTRAAVINVQRKHRITADGIYGPQTRSAMKWRLYHPAKRIWSSGCYSPL